MITVLFLLGACRRIARLAILLLPLSVEPLGLESKLEQ